MSFQFECIGSSQTDDEIVIAGSLKEFGRLINAIEDERDRMVNKTKTNMYYIVNCTLEYDFFTVHNSLNELKSNLSVRWRISAKNTSAEPRY